MEDVDATAAEPAVDLRLEDVDALVGWTVIRAAHHVERQLTAVFAAHDLTPVQFGVLAYLSTGVEVTQAELARAVLVRPQSMASVVSDLVARDLLQRTGARGRGRANPIAVSAEGRRLLARAWPAVVGVDERLTAGLTGAQARQLVRQLRGVLDTARTP